MSAVAQASAHLLTSDPGSADPGIPYSPLKSQIAGLMAMRGVRCRPEQIVLTTGNRSALDLLSGLLLDPGSQVMLEETVAGGVRQAAQSQGAEILTVSTHAETGIDLDEVESLLAGGARPVGLSSLWPRTTSQA